MQNTEIVFIPLTFVRDGCILKMLDSLLRAVFLFSGGFRTQKKRPSGANVYTNEMTLGLSHLSPTIKQGSFLFYFSI